MIRSLAIGVVVFVAGYIAGVYGHWLAARQNSARYPIEVNHE